MNDNNKIINKNTNPVVKVETKPQTPQAQVQPVAPVGSVNKEVGLVGSNVSEVLKPSEAEIAISKDLAGLGVEVKKDAPNLTDEHRGVIEHAKQFTPISSSSSGKITLPMSEEEVAEKLKTGQDDDSGKGLARLIKKIIKAMGL